MTMTRQIYKWFGLARVRLVALATVAVFVLGLTQVQATSEPEPVALQIVTTTSTTTSSTTTTTTTVVTADSRRTPIPPQQISVAELPATTVPDGVRCPDMWPIISSVFPASEWANADYVAYKESRCQPDAVRAGADWGLFQINKSAHSQWIQEDWGYTMENLLNAEINAFMAFIIYLRGVEYTGCGWSAWYMSVNPDTLC